MQINFESKFEEARELSEEQYLKLKEIYPGCSREQLLEALNVLTGYAKIAFPIADRFITENPLITKHDIQVSNDLDPLLPEDDLDKEELLKVRDALDEYLLTILKIHSKATRTTKFDSIIATLETDLNLGASSSPIRRISGQGNML